MSRYDGGAHVLLLAARSCSYQHTPLGGYQFQPVADLGNPSVHRRRHRYKKGAAFRQAGDWGLLASAVFARGMIGGARVRLSQHLTAPPIMPHVPHIPEVTPLGCSVVATGRKNHLPLTLQPHCHRTQLNNNRLVQSWTQPASFAMHL